MSWIWVRLALLKENNDSVDLIPLGESTSNLFSVVATRLITNV